MKTPNNIRSARNAAARAARSIIAMTERAMEMERFAAEHANDCWCDLCQVYGQGAHTGFENLSKEEQDTAMAGI